MENDDIEDVIHDLSCIPADPPSKREQCIRCRYIIKTCFYIFLLLVLNNVNRFYTFEIFFLLLSSTA